MPINTGSGFCFTRFHCLNIASTLFHSTPPGINEIHSMKSKLSTVVLLLVALILSSQSTDAQDRDAFAAGPIASDQVADATFAPVLVTSPTPVNFTNLLVNDEVKTQELLIENTGDEDLIVTSIELVGHDFTMFSLNPTTIADPIPPGGSVSVEVILTPPSTPRSVFTTIEVNSNGGDAVAPVVAIVRNPGTFYVSPLGDNSNPGTQAEPWKTIQFAVNEAVAGDVLMVEDGVYQGPVIMTRSGAPDAYITLKAVNQWGAKIEVANGMGAEDGIKTVANYLTIDGFEIYDVAPAEGHHGNGVTVYTNHHVNVLNNKIYNFGGSGIQATYFDHVHIENNIVYNNAKYNPNQTSGISMYQARAVDDAPGYHAIIRNNRSYGNINLVPLGTAGTKDGNGILIDDFRNSAGDNPSNVVFPHRTLIENNLCYDNGGKGLQVFKSDHVDVFNNTVYHNNHDLQSTSTWRGELSLISSTDTVWRNNIGVSNPGDGVLVWNSALFISKGGDTVWENNLTFNGNPGELGIHIDNSTLTEEYLIANNVLGADPSFMNASGEDFTLQNESPAVNAGSDDIISFFDINYLKRNQGVVDIGAFELDGEPLPVELTSFDALVKDTDVLLSWTTASELNNAGFAVELQALGRDFEQVMFVTGHGTTDAEQVYETTLQAVAPGTYGVRLKQLDFDGTFEYSQTISVTVAADAYHLAQSYPNPFNPQTRIEYTLPVGGHVNLEVFDLLGRSVRTLVREEQPAGTHTVIFEAGDLPNGTYVYRLTAGAFKETRTMVLLK